MNNEPPDNDINMNSLTEIDKGTFKKIFAEISNLQTKLGFEYKGGM